jgi:MtrB/PioB family decaheme-associated outer membrane protein
MKLIIHSIIISLLIMSVPLSSVFSAETTFEGEVTAQGRLVHVNGNEAKFNEYSDKQDGIFGAIGLRYDSENYFMQFKAKDIGYDTQKYTLDGGMWGKFRYNLFYNEIPHNITFGAKTFFSGVGGSSLKIKGNPNDVSTWSSFDYKTERERFGGGMKLDFLNPFFLDVSAQTEKKEGTRPTAGGDFSGVVELPEPVDYRTDTFKVEGGYSKRPFFASLSYFYSKFDNADQSLDFFNPFIMDTDSVTLPPDNKYYKAAFKGAVSLPFNSRFSVNAGTARAKSNTDSNIILDLKDFTGKVSTKNLDLVLTSHPVSFLDGKIFYKYYGRKNRSDDPDDTMTNLGYINRSSGGRLGVKLPAHFRFTAGYKSELTTYSERFDAKRKQDDVYSADLAWSGLDFATFKVGYEKLHRSNDRKRTEAAADEDTIWRFDIAPADRETFKASVDIFPIEDLSVTLGYKYKKTKYEDRDIGAATSGLGLRDYKTDEVFVDASYLFSKYARVYGYFDYEKVRSFQFGHSGSEATDWSVRQKEKNLDYGAGADFFVIPKKLTLKVKYDYLRSDGSAAFEYLDIPTPADIDISNWDDYRKKAFSVKAVYDVMKSISVTAGYVYEQFKLDDIQLEEYQYTPGGSTPAYLTGAYKDPDYNANVVFLALTYRF